MTTSNLLWFAVAMTVTLLLLLWRMIRAEDGYGFMPISRDVTYILVSASLQAFALACFVFALLMLIA